MKTFWASCFLTVGLICCGIVVDLFYEVNDTPTNIMKAIFMAFAIFNIYQFLIRVNPAKDGMK